MAQSRWPEIQDKLILVEGWARDGLTDIQIAHNLGISKDTFYKYKNQHADFADSLKRNKEIADREVENALYKRATGYKYVETTRERAVDPETGEMGLVVTKTVTKEVAPDPTSIIYWLGNRKRDTWRNVNKMDVSLEGNLTFDIVPAPRPEGVEDG